MKRNLYAFVNDSVIVAYNSIKAAYSMVNKAYEKRLATVTSFFEKYDECNNKLEMIPVKFWVMLVNCICITVLRGKLDGFNSISTSPLLNNYCDKRKKCGKLICFHCYAVKQLQNVMYRATMLCLEINSIILNNILIPEKYLAMIQFDASLGYGRIESHGDVASVTCAMNYINFIKTHDWIDFTIWSKNLDIWDKAIKACGKPANMTFTYSSEEVNVISEIPKKYQYFVDHRFTCFDIDYAREHGIKINCGFYTDDYREINHQCKHCLKCYDKKYLDIFDIFELVKGDKTIKKASKEVREKFLEKLFN